MARHLKSLILFTFRYFNDQYNENVKNYLRISEFKFILATLKFLNTNLEPTPLGSSVNPT